MGVSWAWLCGGPGAALAGLTASIIWNTVMRVRLSRRIARQAREGMQILAAMGFTGPLTGPYEGGWYARPAYDREEDLEHHGDV